MCGRRVWAGPGVGGSPDKRGGVVAVSTVTYRTHSLAPLIAADKPDNRLLGIIIWQKLHQTYELARSSRETTTSFKQDNDLHHTPSPPPAGTTGPQTPQLG